MTSAVGLETDLRTTYCHRAKTKAETMWTMTTNIRIDYLGAQIQTSVRGCP